MNQSNIPGINWFRLYLADHEDKSVVDNVANLPDRIEGLNKRYDFFLGIEKKYTYSHTS